MAIQVTEEGFATLPSNYQEWLECFGYIKEHPERTAALRSLRGAAVSREERALDLFLQRLDEMLRETFNRRITRFLARVDDLLSEGDVDGAELQALRFCRGMGDLFFFESLRGLPGDSRTQFSNGYGKQLDCFWDGFVAQARAQAEQSREPAMEDFAYRLARMKGIWHRKGGEE